MLDYIEAKRLRDKLWKWEESFDDNPWLFGAEHHDELLTKIYNEILAEREWLDELIEQYEISLGQEDQPN